jgi:hypothetical protein
MIFRTYRGSVITAMMRIVDGWFIVTAPRGFLEKPAGMHTELSTLKPELSLLQMALCGVVELLNLEKHR